MAEIPDAYTMPDEALKPYYEALKNTLNQGLVCMVLGYRSFPRSGLVRMFAIKCLDPARGPR